MSNSNNSSRSGGISLAGVLTIVFVVLKLTHNIAWSWWWVLSPLWISFGLFLLVVILAGLTVAFGRRSSRSRRHR